MRPASASCPSGTIGASARSTTCFSSRSGFPWRWRSRQYASPRPAPLWVVAGTFLGCCGWSCCSRSSCFGACSSNGWKSGPGAGRPRSIITSLLFGLAHLWFRGFPNWRWVAGGGHAGLVLRPRAQPGRQHPRRNGHPRASGHDLASFLLGYQDISSESMRYKNW